MEWDQYAFLLRQYEAVGWPETWDIKAMTDITITDKDGKVVYSGPSGGQPLLPKGTYTVTSGLYAATGARLSTTSAGLQPCP